ncbi:MAG: class I SAM-dependent RNA methyltransferase [Rhizobiaceae bacterium]
MKLTFTSMGARGDGEADAPDGPVHVPYVLPGETANVAVNGTRGTVMALLEASADRIDPACKHFEACGGCALQHWRREPMLDWKRQVLIDALAKRGIEANVEPTIGSEPGERRRVTLSVRSEGGRTVTGYNGAHSHDIIEITECPVASPKIVAAFPLIREMARLLKVTREGGHITVTDFDSGLDVSFSGFEKTTDALRRKLSEFALDRGFARLSDGVQIIVEPVRPVVAFGGITVTPPPGGFLQASARVESAMAALVTDHFKKAKKTADLFAGSGAFAFRIAKVSPVHAIEGDTAATAALDRGRRGLQGLKSITVEQRDLFRRPLLVADLKAYDAVVFDPPRAGAEEQAATLAKSSVRWIAAVSCNPATLARDLRILIDGGYQLKSITPFDQFLWSSHVEAVALLEKPDAGSGPRKIFG